MQRIPGPNGEDIADGERRKPDSRVTKMYTDMYEGRGQHNPSITSRLLLLEDDVEGVKSTIRRVEKIEWGILIALVIDFITMVFKTHQ